MKHKRLRGLIPVKLDIRQTNEPRVIWGRTDSDAVKMPMFNWATRAVEEEVTTGIDVLLNFAETFDRNKFCGSIVHVSRCGSTAMANALKAVPGVLVLSEPDFISRLIREASWGGAPVPDDLRSSLVYGYLSAVVKEFPASDIVIKCSSASTITLEQSFKYMPRVRWSFLSRNPHDVMLSLIKEPGAWLKGRTTRERLLLQIERASSATTEESRNRDLYAFLLERFYRSILADPPANTRYLDYSDFGIESVVKMVSWFLGRDVSYREQESVEHSLKFYSKAVVRKPFVVDDVKPPILSTGYAELDQAYADFMASYQRQNNEGNEWYSHDRVGGSPRV